MNDYNTLIYLSQDFLDDINVELLESPIEVTMCKHIHKVVASNTEIILQKEITTPNGNFRLDMALKNNDEIIAIECDGKEFHASDHNTYKDEWRDTLILTYSDVHSIFRFRGSDIERSVENMVYFIYTRYPNFFNEINISRYANMYYPEFDYRMHPHKSLYHDKIFLNYNRGFDQEDKTDFMPVWKNREKSGDRFWDRLLLISLLHQGATIAELFKVKSKYMSLSTEELIKLVNELDSHK